MAPATPPHAASAEAPLGIESVAFATGHGRLVRRANAVLFDPTGANPKLTSAFDDAADDDTAQAHVLDAVLESDLDAAPFAIVRWATDLELLVFGDLEVTTSARSAPSITGAGSATWVEHRVARALIDHVPATQVWCGEPAEPDTNLRLGIAACAGFRLDLVIASIAEATSPAPPTTHARPATIETPALDLELGQPIAQGQPLDTERIQPVPVLRQVIGAEPVPGDATPSLLEFDDPAPTSDPEPEPAIQVWMNDDDSASDRHDDDTDADPFALTDDEPVAGVEPTAAAAMTTSELLEFDGAEPAASAPSPTVETEPAIATLVFDDHPDLTITAPAVLGRRPSATAGRTALTVDHPEVSRTHAEILVSPSPTISDLGSRNGTWVQPPDGSGLRRLGDGELAPLDPGTIVHLGSVEVCFTWQPAATD